MLYPTSRHDLDWDSMVEKALVTAGLLAAAAAAAAEQAAAHGAGRLLGHSETGAPDAAAGAAGVWEDHPAESARGQAQGRQPAGTCPLYGLGCGGSMSADA